jgi:hypothetical protein
MSPPQSPPLLSHGHPLPASVLLGRPSTLGHHRHPLDLQKIPLPAALSDHHSDTVLAGGRGSFSALQSHTGFSAQGGMMWLPTFSLQLVQACGRRGFNRRARPRRERQHHCEFVRGVSGGERKRVGIGLTPPPRPASSPRSRRCHARGARSELA